MAFSSRRGRPRKPLESTDSSDFGTPELRAKRRYGITSEPIDRCLEKNLITAEQHRSGLHLRWLYTLRYGAPQVTTQYVERESGNNVSLANEAWRSLREQEFAIACELLRQHRSYDPLMRLAIHNEVPAFLSPTLLQRAWQQPALASELDRLHRRVSDGLQLLVVLWRKGAELTPQPQAVQNCRAIELNP